MSAPTNTAGAATPTVPAVSTQAPGEYDGEAESRESDYLARYIADRLVTPRPDCMIWTAATDRGYGRIFLDGTAKRVHRVAWEMANGPIPDGLTIDHLCRVRACCNTGHMELVTGSENTRRAAPYRPNLLRFNPRGRGRKSPRVSRIDTHCRNGHEYTPENTGVRSDGTGRQCLTCRRANREREKAARARARAARKSAA